MISSIPPHSTLRTPTHHRRTLFFLSLSMALGLGICLLLGCQSTPSSHIEYTPASVTITQTETIPSTTSFTYEFEGESPGLPLSISTVDLWDPPAPTPLETPQ